jgi:hypothetical protein
VSDALEKVMGTRGPVRINHVALHTWGANPRRVVRVHVFERDGATTAVVYGAQGRQVIELERFDVAEAIRTPVGRKIHLTLVLSDGRRLEAPHGGCACSSPLKHFVPPGWRAGT